MTLSFRLKTIIGIVLIEAVMLIILVWSSLNYLYESNIEEFDHRIKTTTHLFSTTIKNAVLSTDLAELESHVDELTSNPDIVYVRVRNMEHVLTQRGKQNTPEKPFNADTSYEQVDDGVYDTRTLLKTDTYIFGQVEIGFSIESIQTILQDAKQHISSIAVLEIILVSLFSFALGTLLTRQLNALQFAANTIKHSGPGSQIEIIGKDELAQTAMAFNSMSTELKISYDLLRQETQQSHDQKEKVNAIMNNVPSGIILLNESGSILSTNQAMKDLLQQNSEPLENTHMSDHMPEWDRVFKEYLEPTSYHKTTSQNSKSENHIIRHNGTLVPVQMSIAPTHGENEKQYILSISDISDYINSQKELGRANILLSEYVKSIESKHGQILLLTNFGHILQKSNTIEDTYNNISQYGKTLFPGLNGSLYIKNEVGKMEKRTQWGKENESLDEFNLSDCLALHGTSIHPPVAIEKSALCNHIKQIDNPMDNGNICIPIIANGDKLGLLHIFGEQTLVHQIDRAFVNIVKEQIGMTIYNIFLKDKLIETSTRDSLTGLYNRRFMEESLNQETNRAIRSKGDISICLLDMDHFKKINDTYGHAAGDLVLIKLSKLLLDYCRSQDVVCRYGGEEFIIILPGTNVVSATALVEKILISISKLEIIYEEKEIFVTASAGVSSYRSNGNNEVPLIDAADKALYQAKNNGRNQAFVADIKQNFG